MGYPGPKAPKSKLAVVPVVNEMLDSASAVPVSTVARAMTTPAAILRFRDMRRLLSMPE
jgi:hypothetical protein